MACACQDFSAREFFGGVVATGSAGKDPERVAAVAAIRKELGARLRALREARGATVEAIGSTVGVTRQTVSGWELGEGEPNEADVLRLATFYGIAPAEVRYGPAAPTGPLEMYEAGRREMGEWIGQMIQAAIDGPQVVTQRIAEPASETFQTATRDNLSAIERAARTGAKRRKTGGK